MKWPTYKSKEFPFFFNSLSLYLPTNNPLHTIYNIPNQITIYQTPFFKIPKKTTCYINIHASRHNFCLSKRKQPYLVCFFIFFSCKTLLYCAFKINTLFCILLQGCCCQAGIILFIIFSGSTVVVVELLTSTLIFSLVYFLSFLNVWFYI